MLLRLPSIQLQKPDENGLFIGLFGHVSQGFGCFLISHKFGMLPGYDGDGYDGVNVRSLI